MNIQEVKSLCSKFSIEQLKQAENDVMNEVPLQIQVEGKDDGEVLSHILASIVCLEEIQASGCTINEAVRVYSLRVRNSIN